MDTDGPRRRRKATNWLNTQTQHFAAARFAGSLLTAIKRRLKSSEFIRPALRDPW